MYLQCPSRTSWNLHNLLSVGILFVVLNVFSASLCHPEDKCSRVENCKGTSGSKDSCMFFVTEKNAFSFGF